MVTHNTRIIRQLDSEVRRNALLLLLLKYMAERATLHHREFSVYWQNETERCRDVPVVRNPSVYTWCSSSEDLKNCRTVSLRKRQQTNSRKSPLSVPEVLCVPFRAVRVLSFCNRSCTSFRSSCRWASDHELLLIRLYYRDLIT